jgi:mRNA interferase RelE/StbE
MDIELSKEATKVLNRMDKTTRIRLVSAIYKLPDGDIVSLKGRENTYRLRIGDWRVVYSFKSTDKILISKIASRGDVYKGV